MIGARDHARPDRAGGASRAGRLAVQSSVLWILLVLVGLFVMFSVILPAGTFLSVFNIKTIAAESAVILILGVAATFVIVSGGLDLSIGSIMALAAVAGSLTMKEISNNGTENEIAAILAGCGVGLAVGVGWGALNGALITFASVPPFVVTLGSLGAALGAARLLSDGVSVSGNPPALQGSFGQAEALGVPAPFLLAAIVVVIFGLVLSKTRFGEHSYLIGSNEEAARRGGIHISRHVIAIYALSGLLAGLAGLIDLSRFDVASVATGHVTELIAAIAAVVIGGASLFGGVGGVGGTVIGVYIPVVLANGLLIGGVERFWQDVLIGAILVAAVAFDQWRRTQESKSRT